MYSITMYRFMCCSSTTRSKIVVNCVFHEMDKGRKFCCFLDFETLISTSNSYRRLLNQWYIIDTYNSTFERICFSNII